MKEANLKTCIVYDSNYMTFWKGKTMETIKGSELAKVKKEEGMERQNTVAGSAGGGCFACV